MSVAASLALLFDFKNLSALVADIPTFSNMATAILE